MVFKIVNRGTVFATRERGRELLFEVCELRSADHEEVLVLDFDGVKTMTDSVIHMFVLPLMWEAIESPLRPLPELINMSEEVKKAIDWNFRARGITQHLAA